ncbi:MAG: fucose isomerase [Clostridiales bacterium]|nr:fucose isomerase [Clostridiales bacterium]
MKHKIKLGVVCLTRNTFDFQAAKEMYDKVLLDLNKLLNVEIISVKETVMDTPEAIDTGRLFAENSVDGLVIISGTFHLGHLLLEIKKTCDKPILLWALPELPYNGGKIRLNSACGVNLNASNLVKSGINDFVYHIGPKIDENWVDAIRMIVALRDSRIGIVGYRAHGFFNVGVNELALYGKFGVIVDHYELSELYNEMATETDKYLEKLNSTFDSDEVPQEKKMKVASLASSLKGFMTRHNLKALAIRCWPEFASSFGIAPCASMSLIQDDDYIVACEGDIDCTITMICHQAAGANTPFMADISQVNLEENSALLWHCGVAPCNLRDGRSSCTLDSYHAGGKGMTAGFVLKTGEVSIARLDSINGSYRLFLEKGTSHPMDKLLTGTYAKVVFSHPMKEVFDKVVYTGIAHHVSMVYGDFSDVFKIFARLKNIEIL